MDSTGTTWTYSYDNAGNYEQYYSDSEHEDVSCNRHDSNIQEELKKLDGRIMSDITAAKAGMHAF